MARRKTEVFSMSFLDCITCGLGSVVLLLVLSNIRAPSIEQFRPLAGANPTLGGIDELVRAPSVRVEFCIPRDDARLRRLIEAGIRPNHPWEVPAIFVDESSMPTP